MQTTKIYYCSLIQLIKRFVCTSNDPQIASLIFFMILSICLKTTAKQRHTESRHLPHTVHCDNPYEFASYVRFICLFIYLFIYLFMVSVRFLRHAAVVALTDRDPVVALQVEA